MIMTTINMVITVFIKMYGNTCAYIDPNRQAPFVDLNSKRCNLHKFLAAKLLSLLLQRLPPSSTS